MKQRSSWPWVLNAAGAGATGTAALAACAQIWRVLDEGNRSNTKPRLIQVVPRLRGVTGLVWISDLLS